MKFIIKLFKIFVFLIFLFTTFSILVCVLPNGAIQKNIEKSLPEFSRQKNSYKAIIEKKPYQVDVFTEGIFLSQNYMINPKSPIQSAMLVPIVVYSWEMAEGLEYQMATDNPNYRNYPRYWNGNSFLLRLLLLIGDYSLIRWLLYVVSSLLLFTLCAKLYQHVGLINMLVFSFGLLCVNIFVTQFSMQFFTITALSIIASILICNRIQFKSESIAIIFFVIGCLTSYFDLLTAPILTLGIPLIVFFMVKQQDSLTWKAGFKDIFLFSLVWGIGFAFTWISKWAIGTLLTDVNVFVDAYENILIRTSTEDYSRFDAIIANIDMLPLVFINIAACILGILSICFFYKKGIKNAVFFLSISLFPYFWYMVLANHSYEHFWFTYRAQAITIIGVFMALMSLISCEKIQAKKSHKKNSI